MGNVRLDLTLGFDLLRVLSGLRFHFLEFFSVVGLGGLIL